MCTCLLLVGQSKPNGLLLACVPYWREWTGKTAIKYNNAISMFVCCVSCRELAAFCMSTVGIEMYSDLQSGCSVLFSKFSALLPTPHTPHPLRTLGGSTFGDCHFSRISPLRTFKIQSQKARAFFQLEKASKHGPSANFRRIDLEKLVVVCAFSGCTTTKGESSADFRRLKQLVLLFFLFFLPRLTLTLRTSSKTNPGHSSVRGRGRGVREVGP